MFSSTWLAKTFTRIGVAAIATVGLGVAACGPTTSIEQSWTAPTARAEQLRRVVTLYISRDGATRRAAEDHLARDLASRGVSATPAYVVLVDADLDDIEQAKAKLRRLGFDGVVAMRLVDKEHQLEYMPGTFDAYWGYAWPGYGYYDGGYAYTETIVRIETNAYSLATNQLVWSAVSKTVDPENTQGLIEDVTKVVAEQLTERGLAG